MNRRALLLIAGAVICGLIAILLVNQYITKQEKEIFKGMALTEIVAVSQDVEAGTKISRDILTTKQVPEKYVHANAISPEDMDFIVGQTLNFPLKKGDPILFTDIGEERIRMRMGRLAGKVMKGERALSISVDSVTGVSGLLAPNDHVDILGTFRNQETGEEATLTLLQNITVLATGSVMSGEEQTQRSYATVTLQVTLQESELLVFAQERGRLTLLLRNPEDMETNKDIPKVTFSNIMKTEYRKEIQKQRDRIEIIKRGKSVQGGE
ncbi:MAG: Flp pilus assembly protein CpaB [Desulfobacterales bacterium]|nr:Flp pilus assembly protein CpaB [Desulfobacterales bacterium]